MIWIANATSQPIHCPRKGCPDIEPGEVHRDTADGGHVIEQADECVVCAASRRVDVHFKTCPHCGARWPLPPLKEPVTQ